MMREACTDCELEQFDRAPGTNSPQRLDYVALDASDPAHYGLLKEALAGREQVVRVFYLATAPDLFVPVADQSRRRPG